MKDTEKTLKCLGRVGLMAVLIAVAGCQSARDRSLAQQWGDHQVAGQVKKELGKDPFYKYPDVHPVVYEGTVQLTGFVETPEQRLRAAELASHGKGVRQVVNVIALKPTPTVPQQVSVSTPATVAPVAEATPPQTVVPGPTPATSRMRPPATHQVPTQGAAAAQQIQR